jgi:hypothetical protein
LIQRWEDVGDSEKQYPLEYCSLIREGKRAMCPPLP